MVPALEIEYNSTSPPSYPPIGKPARTNESSFPLPAAFRLPQVSHASISSLKWITVPGITACACISPRPLQWMPPTTTVTLKWYGARFRIPEKGEKWVESPRPETHQGAFTSVSNGKVGLTIANRGLPEVEVLENDGHTEIAVTLLRSVGWLSRDDLPVRQGHAGPASETPGGQVQGKSVFEYAMILHKGDWQDSFLQAYCLSKRIYAPSKLASIPEKSLRREVSSHHHPPGSSSAPSKQQNMAKAGLSAAITSHRKRSSLT